ncbi:expressed unknown protein [Seminavis robusta]|uniref:Uncharacterized protein n=1 Tax=Seminavis robusta TaxID=568900 RepID=A0A9N8EG29_9STRA|nr:expressed unknown protein [Seminavis robusta]|eukprot:Sro1043_g234770.1 n/a (240) ;mRNA; r:7752-8591
MSVWSLLVGILAICLVSATSSSEAGSTSYVFLQKFPLANTGGWIFHTEVLVCPQEGFSLEDQKYLDGSIASLTDFAEIPTTWWSSRTANCIEFGYGGAPCTERCCGAPHKDPETHFPLNEKRAVIGNADTEQKSLYLYGNSGNKTGDFAYHALCDTSHETCWSNWAGVDYNPLTNNCNTFTSTILHCIYGLSEKKPNLGPSDMVTVTCDKCPIYMNNSPTQDTVNERMMLRHSSATSGI